MAQHFPQTPLKERSSTTTLRLRVLMEHQQRLEIGNRIRDLRESSPETNRSIADYVGVGERSVANWISGSTGITYKHARKVAELFRIDVRWLWDGEERVPTPDVLGALSPNGEISAALAGLDQKMAKLLAGQSELRSELALLRKRQEDQLATQAPAPRKRAAKGK